MFPNILIKGKNINLQNIISPVENELKEFGNLFSNSMKSDVPLLDLVIKYILKQKGKRIRPSLVLLSANLSGGVTERSYRGAILVELLHTATLVHDDVVDEAETRRSIPSINAIWKNKIAVLVGDYLLSRGLMKAVEGEDFDFLKIVTNTVKRMSEGELLQISKTKKLNNDEATYYRIISDKTASLFGTCCEIGGLSSHNNKEHALALREFGELLGTAFQIRDDILDYIGISSIFGKKVGTDVRDKKITLPLIYSLQKASNEESSLILKKIKKYKENSDVKDVIEFVKNSGGVKYAEEKTIEIAKAAKEKLAIFDNSIYKESLYKLIDFVVSRNK